jgi:peptidoglycan/LPS O-acetylase OafA/YrhL
LKRIAVLDSLRGLAALTVVLEHCLISLPGFNKANGYRDSGKLWVNALTFSPLHTLWDGHEAVIFFFLLSGFVLALPFLYGRRINYRGFLVKRLCRLYLPYLAVILISAALLTFVFENQPVDGRVNGLSSWFDDIWSHPVTPAVMLHYLLMSGKDTHNLDVSSWSLVHELRISIFFPLLILLIRRLRTRYTAPVFIALALASASLYDALPYRLGATVYYVSFFAFGILLAKHKDAIRRTIERLPRAAKLGILAATVVVYNADWFPLVHQWFGQRRPGVDLLIAVAAALVIALALGCRRMGAWLTKEPLLTLGKVSFSLYLIHPVVLAGMVYALDGHLSHRMIILLVPPVSILTALFIYRFVERPSIRIGRQLAAVVTPNEAKTNKLAA